MADSRPGALRILEPFAPMIYPLLFLAAAYRLTMRLAADFGGASLPESWQKLGIWARENERLAENLHLSAAVLAVVFILPSFVRRSLRFRIRTTILVITSLVILGASTVRVLLPHPAVLLVQAIGLAVCFACAAVAAIRYAETPNSRLAVGAFLVAMIFPCAWRVFFELSGGHAAGQIHAMLRRASDICIPGSLLLFLLLLDLSRNAQKRTMIAAVPAVFFLASALVWPGLVRELLADVTQLWLTSMPWAATAIIAALALFAVVRTAIDSCLGAPAAGLAAALLLWLMIGVLPTRSAQILTSLVACLLVVAWTEDRAASPRDLSDVFS